MDDQNKLKVAFCRSDKLGFDRVVDELYLTISQLKVQDILDLDYVVMCQEHAPYLIVKVDEVAFIKSKGNSVQIRCSDIRSVWNNAEARQELNEITYDFDGWRPVIYEFSSDRFFCLATPVQLKAKVRSTGALGLDQAIKELADTYRVDASQVTITITAKGKD